MRRARLRVFGRPRVTARAADRVDRRLDRARRRDAREGDEVRGARRQVLSTVARRRRFWTSTATRARRASHARGLVIPAHPAGARRPAGKLDERRQRALTRYYLAAGAGGSPSACTPRSSRSAIRRSGLFEPVLALAAEEMARADARRDVPVVRIGGICGPTAQAAREAEPAARPRLPRRAPQPRGAAQVVGRRAARALPRGVRGHPARRLLPPTRGRRAAAAVRVLAPLRRDPNVVAIKIAPFNRYQTLDVVRAVAESGRDDIALYTGNDDNIVADLITPFRFDGAERRRSRGASSAACSGTGRSGRARPWSCSTSVSTRLPTACRASCCDAACEVTDANAAFFDAAHGFAGCIAGLHEVLRRQGLLASMRCLDPARDAQPRPARGDRPRLSGVPAPERRRVRRAAPRRRGCVSGIALAGLKPCGGDERASSSALATVTVIQESDRVVRGQRDARKQRDRRRSLSRERCP